MAVELKDAVDPCRLLEEEDRAKVTDLEKAWVAAKEARSKIRATKEELNQAVDIVSGKPFLLRTKFGHLKYAPLDRLWSSADKYMDLAASAADVAEYFKDQRGPEVEKLFWSQFHTPVRPLLLNERLTGWAELHRLSGLAMRSIVDHLWSGGPRPSSYFSLVQQFLEAVPCIDAIKRSACIEDARMALAHVKTYWAEMEASTIAAQGLAIGRVAAKHYFEEVLEGTRSIEAQCSKNIIFQ
ncbi:hypothetical protein VPH35_020068 [Triticum aestivum]